MIANFGAGSIAGARGRCGLDDRVRRRLRCPVQRHSPLYMCWRLSFLLRPFAAPQVFTMAERRASSHADGYVATLVEPRSAAQSWEGSMRSHSSHTKRTTRMGKLTTHVLDTAHGRPGAGKIG